MEDKKCTRCKSEHEESGSYCEDCKSYMRTANKWRNERFSKRFNAPLNSVYAFVEEGDIVYIGSSSEPSKRIYEHYNDNDKTFDKKRNGLLRQLKYRWQIIYTGDDYKTKEKTLIYKHKPKFNKIQYEKFNKELESSRNRRSSLSIRFRQLLRFLQGSPKEVQDQ